MDFGLTTPFRVKSPALSLRARTLRLCMGIALSVISGGIWAQNPPRIPDSIKVGIQRDRMYQFTGADLLDTIDKANVVVETEYVPGDQLFIFPSPLTPSQMEQGHLNGLEPMPGSDTNLSSVRAGGEPGQPNDGTFCVKVVGGGEVGSFVQHSGKPLVLEGGARYELSYSVFSSRQHDFFTAWMHSDLSYLVGAVHTDSNSAYASNQPGRWTHFVSVITLPETGRHTCWLRIGNSYKEPITWYIDGISLRKLTPVVREQVVRPKTEAERAFRLKSIRADRVNLYAGGKPVPIELSPVGPEGGLLPETMTTFWGNAPRVPENEKRIYSKENVYTLQFDSDDPPARLVRTENLPRPGRDEAVPSSYPKTLHVERDAILQHYQQYDGPPSDRVMWAEFSSPPKAKGHIVQVGDVPGMVPGSPCKAFRAYFWGKSGLQDVSPDHRWQVILNGTRLGNAVWDGTRDHLFEAANLKQDAVQPTGNTLQLTCTSDPKHIDAISLDWIEFEYDAVFEAPDDYLEYMLPTGSAYQSIRLTPSFSGPEIRVFSDQGVELETDSQHSGTGYYAEYTYPVAQAGTTFRAVGPTGFVAPERFSVGYASDLRASSEPPEYLVITCDRFLETVQPLLEHRRRQGLTALAVDVEDIYDEYGNGNLTPLAIRAFIDDLLSKSAQSPRRIRYVFLIGDATYDYYNLLHGQENIVPTYHEEMGGYRPDYSPTYANDSYFAYGPSGGDVPEAAVGRIPSTSAERVQSYVQKVLAYEGMESGSVDMSAPWRHRAVLMSSPEFTSFCERFRQAYLAGWDIETHYAEAGPTAGLDLQANIVHSLARGCGLLYFAGHGGGSVWGTGRLGDKTALFTHQHVQLLENQKKYPIVFTSTCFSALYDAPERPHQTTDTGIGVALVESKDKGAVALIGHVGKATVNGSHVFVAAVMDSLSRGEAARLGDAFLHAKQTCTVTEVAGLALIGDPALVVRPFFSFGDSGAK